MHKDMSHNFLVFSLSAVIIVSLAFFAINVNERLSGYYQGQLSQLVYIASGKTDSLIFRDCFGGEATAGCERADFNDDGLVGVTDFNIAREASLYDLNKDGIVDFSSAFGSDVSLLVSCFESGPTFTCADADFNADGVVDILDLEKMQSALILDLNGDRRIDLINMDPSLSCTDTDGPFSFYEKGGVYGEFSYDGVTQIKWWDDSCAGGEAAGSVYEFYCSSELDDDSSRFSVSRELVSCPNGCIDGACVPDKYDLTLDGIVDNRDVLVVANAIDGVASLAVADLNGDSVIDQKDMSVIRNYIYYELENKDAFFDLNADGVLDSNDLNFVSIRDGSVVGDQEYTVLADITDSKKIPGSSDNKIDNYDYSLLSEYIQEKAGVGI